ncbi:asparagine synthetase B [Agaricicola taiwanensis]|uniref:asparagine synthase (glutamine-hydrolyzing) n=1 Tax=Agaricicola taiwanensis TaxID=591372 RepID=A0A8J2VFP0_9RHOB|nr:asparagine synthase (glutamine-hydrolyzing) [Agaricicola taiwanensis]GGE29775.1 asparagine synthetase B [Agaricicola taiwanensis]
MCGIAGFFGQPPNGAAAVLADMIGAVRHRGPDASGIHIKETAGLAHARLSIIDIASGQQPMRTADDELSITFNGEIFNYVELKTELERHGHIFRTASDTEVILHAYRQWDVDCVSRFNGDFAFALHDARQRRLFASRDRMGVRPFFFTRQGRCIYFASEIKALLTVPGITAEIDPIALDQIFTFWCPLAPRTGFKGIEELEPGHRLIAESDRLVCEPYWRLTYPRSGEEEEDRRSEPEIREELRALLLDATELRLRSDVPVGAYLSGGLDSSIITAAVKHIRSDRLRTFSVTFDNAEFDETAFQNEMVAALGTAHSAVATTPADIGALFPQVIKAAERPILRTAPAPLHRLSALVRDEHFKVVLTGEGADELFAGYDIFKEAKIRRFIAAQPQSSRRPLLLRKLYPYLPRLAGQSQTYLESFFGARPGDETDPLFSHLPRFRNTASAKMFFSGALKAELGGYDALADLRDRLPADFPRWHPLSQAQYLEAGLLLPGYILSSQGDRAAMANAVEGRFPFLDHRVVEFAARIPPRFKMRALREKHILRDAFQDLLPKTIANRIKQPYRAPDAPSFSGPDAPAWVSDTLATDRVRDAGLFEPRAVEKLMTKCNSGRPLGFKDNAALVGIVSTQLWHDMFTKQAAQPPARKIA